MTDPSSSGTDPAKVQSHQAKELSLAEEMLQTSHELRASIVSNVITKGMIGLGIGGGLALFVFKRRVAPVMLMTGFGLGMAYAEGSQMVQDYHEGIRRRAIGSNATHHQQTPPGLPHN